MNSGQKPNPSPDVLMRWLFSIEAILLSTIGLVGANFGDQILPQNWAGCAHHLMLPGLAVVCKKTSMSSFATLWFTSLPVIFVVLARPWLAARGNQTLRDQISASHETFSRYQKILVVLVLAPGFVLLSWAALLIAAISNDYAQILFGTNRAKDIYCVLGSVVLLQLFCGGQFVALEKFSNRKSILEK